MATFGALCSAGFDAAGICLTINNRCVIHQLYNPCVSFTAVCTASSTAATVSPAFPVQQHSCGNDQPSSEDAVRLLAVSGSHRRPDQPDE